MAGGISWFWSERFWLPSNITWADLENTNDGSYPQIDDFYAVIPLAFALLLIRFVFERIIATPFAHLLGVKCRSHYEAIPNTILEKVFRSMSRCPDQKRLEGLAKQLDWSVRSVERWFRCRRNQERPSMLVKFRETCWRCAFYIVAFSYGMYTVPHQPWFWDMKLCYFQFPFHPITAPIYNYYMLEISFYFSLILSLFTDVKRKDFVPQLIHHITTIYLLGFSWACNFTRIGCIVLVTHDVADIFLEAGKMLNYASKYGAANVLFGVFSAVYFISRIIFLPFWVIYSSLVQSIPIMGPFPAYYLFNGLLLILQVLNVYWFTLILNMVYKAIVVGQLTKDDRSDVEENLSDSEKNEEENGINNHNDVTNHNGNHTKYTNYAIANSKQSSNHH